MRYEFADQKLVSKIYDVSTRPECWVDLLDILPGIVNAKSSAIVVTERCFSSGELLSHFGVFSQNINAEKIAEYNRNYMHYEVAYAERVAASEAGTLVSDPDFDDRHTIVKRPDVAFAIEHFDVIDRFAVKLNDEAAWSDALTFQYPCNRGNVTDEEFASLKPLIPSLAQSVSQMRMFESIRKRYSAVFSVLSRLDIAVVVLDKNSRIVLSNECADELIDRSGHLRVNQQRELVSTDSQHRLAIMQAVKLAASTACGASLHAKQQFRLGDDHASDNLLLEITPLSDANAEIESGFRGAMMLVVDPNRAMAVPIDALKLLYGLTNSEAEVAALLGDGYTYNSVAEARNVQPETIKTQVASLYRKMKTDSRAGLIRRIFSISLPFRDG